MPGALPAWRMVAYCSSRPQFKPDRAAAAAAISTETAERYGRCGCRTAAIVIRDRERIRRAKVAAMLDAESKAAH